MGILSVIRRRKKKKTITVKKTKPVTVKNVIKRLISTKTLVVTPVETGFRDPVVLARQGLNIVPLEEMRAIVLPRGLVFRGKDKEKIRSIYMRLAAHGKIKTRELARRILRLAGITTSGHVDPLALYLLLLAKSYGVKPDKIVKDDEISAYKFGRTWIHIERELPNIDLYMEMEEEGFIPVKEMSEKEFLAYDLGLEEPKSIRIGFGKPKT